MMGRNTGPVRLDAHAMKLLVEIGRKKTNTAEYFSQFLISGSLKSDDGWFNPQLVAGDCTCTEEQLLNYGQPCCVCKSNFAANRVTRDYAQHISLR